MTAAGSWGWMRRTAGGGAALALAALALTRLPLWSVAAALGGAIAVPLLARAPWLIWAALAAALPFAAAQRGAGPVSLLDLLLGVALALWFVDGVRRHRFHAPEGLRLRPSGVARAAALYAGALGVATLAAVDLGEAGAEVVKWLEFCAVLLLLPVMVPRARVPWVAAAALGGAAAQAALGLYQFVFAIGPEWFALGRFMRASGSFAQPNPFGGYMGLMLPVAVSLTLFAVAQWRQTPHTQTLPLLYWAGTAALIGAGLLASWSRGAWLGAAAALGVVVALRSRRTALAAAGALVLLAGALLLGSISPHSVPAPLRARLADLPAYLGGGDLLAQEVTDENFAVVERVAHWAAAWRMVERSPWIGVGPGNYAAVYPEVRLARWEEALGHAHNIYLNVLAESGLLGMAAFMILWSVAAVQAVQAWRCARRRTDGFGAALALGVLGVLAHLAVHSVVDNLFVQGMTVQVALWMALLLTPEE